MQHLFGALFGPEVTKCELAEYQVQYTVVVKVLLHSQSKALAEYVRALLPREPYTTSLHCSGPHSTIEAYIYPVASPCQWGYLYYRTLGSVGW